MRHYGLWVLAGIIIAVTGTFWYVGHVNSTHPAPWPMAGGGSAHSNATAAVFPAQPKLLWSYQLDGVSNGAAPVIWQDGTVYVAQNGRVTAVGPDGKRKWAWNSQSPIVSLALGRQGQVYALSADSLYALASDGTVSWQQTLEIAEARVLMVGQGGVVYVGGRDYLYAVSSTGNRKWRFKGDRISAGPVETSTGRLVVMVDSELYELNTSGDTVWHTASVVPDTPLSLSVGPEDRIYVKGREDQVYDRNGNTLSRSTPTGGTAEVAVGKDFVQDGPIRFDGLWQKPSWSENRQEPGAVTYAIVDRQGNTLIQSLVRGPFSERGRRQFGGQNVQVQPGQQGVQVVPGDQTGRVQLDIFPFSQIFTWGQNGQAGLRLLDPQGQERWAFSDVRPISQAAVAANGRICYVGAAADDTPALVCIGDK